MEAREMQRMRAQTKTDDSKNDRACIGCMCGKTIGCDLI